MIRLQGDARLIIKPRWPYKAVFISEAAYVALIKVQETLDSQEIKLVLTRGYENQGRLITGLHSLGRVISASLFFCLYSNRRHEIAEIFSPNGHDKSGDCVDVSLIYRNKNISLLPQGVLTPKRHVEQNRKTYNDILNQVFQALERVGFRIHSNPTEVLQIHCELTRGSGHAI